MLKETWLLISQFHMFYHMPRWIFYLILLAPGSLGYVILVKINDASGKML